MKTQEEFEASIIELQKDNDNMARLMEEYGDQIKAMDESLFDLLRYGMTMAVSQNNMTIDMVTDDYFRNLEMSRRRSEGAKKAAETRKQNKLAKAS